MTTTAAALATQTGVALSLTGVSKKYPGFTLDVDLVVPRGFVLGLIGANGSGKTTSIKIALGVVHPDAGAVTVAPPERLGVVFDQPVLPPAWTVETVGRTLRRFYPAWDAARYEALTVGRGVPKDSKVGALSRGMGMKLQYAVALSHGAELLILDEPTSGLDPYARDLLLEDLAEFMTDETHSVLFSSHITSDLERIADHITMLAAGRVALSARKDDLLESYRLVSGGSDDLTADARAVAIGLRRHSVGWDALVPTDAIGSLPTGVLIDAPTLDDIAVRFAKENDHAAR